MTQVDSINANYYALQQAQQEAAQNPQQFFVAPQAQGLAQDTVSFSGNGEEKKNHKGLKAILGLAIAGTAAFFLHKNWGTVKNFVRNLIHPVDKEAALKAAEGINKKAKTSAKKINKNLNAVTKKARKKMIVDAGKTNWGGQLELRRMQPGYQAAAETTEQVMMSSYKPRSAREIAQFKEKAAAMKKKLGIESFTKDLMAPKV